MKLKLTTKPKAPAPEASQAPQAAPATATPSSAPKLKFKGLSSNPQPPADGTADVAKIKRKYTKKPKASEDGTKTATKRASDATDGLTSPPAKRKLKPTAKALFRDHSDDDMDDEPAPAPAPPRIALPARQGSKLKLKVKAPGVSSGPQRSSTAVIKIKNQIGKPPVRPPGVGYDSEAEEAEEDPAIESQFILRMQPGPDCDLLRKAIEEKRIGRPSAEGGTSVIFRFFDREGRRALIRIQKNLYAAAMVDLPCVIESMKSWNKKDWVKTADICQMLLVLGPVQSEEEARKYPLPKEVDPHKHLYPHGLTPPMYYVRKRRFRPRQSYHEIEQREAQVNALIEADERARAMGGSSEYQIIDESRMESSEESSSAEEDEDAVGEYDDVAPTTEYVIEGQTPGGEEIEVDEDEFAAMMMEGLGQDDTDLFGGAGGDSMEIQTPATAHDVAMHALNARGQGVAGAAPETAASTPGAATSPDDDDDDDDEGDSADDDVDAGELAEQEAREQQMAEIRELEQEIASTEAEVARTTNFMWKRRLQKKIEQLTEDLNVKKKANGLGDDDGD